MTFRVVQVETLDGRSVWTKRHYRCTPRSVASADLQGEDGSSAGASPGPRGTSGELDAETRCKAQSTLGNIAPKHSEKHCAKRIKHMKAL